MPLADMWRQGELPPPEVQLSRAALLDIKRLKAWAEGPTADKLNFLRCRPEPLVPDGCWTSTRAPKIFQRRQFHRLSSSVGTLTRMCLPGRLN